MTKGERVAVSHDGEIIVHATAKYCHGDYDTLCGVDGNDSSIGHTIVDVPRNGRARINCPQCWAIWQTARAYSSKDFC